MASDVAAGSTLAGPFHVAFRLAFDPLRRVLAAPQRATAGGVTVTLERVVVTRREARVVLRFPAAGADQTTDWQPIVLAGGLNASGAALRLEPLGAWLTARAAVRGWQPDGTWAASLRGPAAFAATGPWKISVSALAVSSATSRRVGGGPWLFAVTLPAATAAP